MLKLPFSVHRYFHLQAGPKKRSRRLMSIILSFLNRLKNFTTRFLGKFAVKRLFKIKIPPHLGYVATLPYGTLMSAKQAITNKLQGNVPAHLRCGGVVNNQIKKGLSLSLRVKKKLKSVNFWQTYKQKRDCLVHFLRLLAVCWPGAQSA